MENILLLQTTKNELIQELKNEILSGITQLLNESKQKDINSKELYTRKEVASRFNISYVTLWSWEKKGLLPSHKIGRNVRYKKDDVLKALIRKESKI